MFMGTKAGLVFHPLVAVTGRRENCFGLASLLAKRGVDAGRIRKTRDVSIAHQVGDELTDRDGGDVNESGLRRIGAGFLLHFEIPAHRALPLSALSQEPARNTAALKPRHSTPKPA